MTVNIEIVHFILMSKIIIMKKATVIAPIIFTVGILMSSCSTYSCPAYSQQDTEQTENVG
jgi:hypothetical protein